MQKNKLVLLASERNSPCVTISMNTHRTYTGNTQDAAVFKTLLKEAEDRVINDYGIRPVIDLLEKIDQLREELNVTNNSDCLHVFLSNSTKEIIKSPWPITQNGVYIADSFAIKPLIKIFTQTEDYLILLLSQSGVKLFYAEMMALPKR